MKGLLSPHSPPPPCRAARFPTRSCSMQSPSMANSDGSLHVPEERLIFSGLDSVRRLDVGGCCGFVAVFATALGNFFPGIMTPRQTATKSFCGTREKADTDRPSRMLRWIPG